MYENHLLTLWVFTIPFEKRHIFNLEQATIGNSVNEWLTISIYISDIIAIAIISILGLNWIFKKQKLSQRKKLYIILYFSILLSGVVATQNTSRSIYLAISLTLSGIIAYRIYSQLKKNVYHSILFSFIVSALLQSTIAIGQFYKQKSLGLKFLGEIDISREITNIPKIISNGETYIRAVGTFTHSNVLAAFLAIAIFFSLILLYEYSQKKIVSQLILLSTIIISFAQILTFSRTGYLVSIIIILYFIATHRKKRAFIKRVLVYLVAISIISISYSSLIVPRGTIADQNGDMAISIRLNLFSESIRQLSLYPITGTGLGQYIPTYINSNPELESWKYQPAHNVPILLLSELGPLVICLFIALIIYKSPKNDYLPLIVVIIGLPSITDHYYATIHQGQLLLLLLIAISYSTVPRGTVDNKER